MEVHLISNFSFIGDKAQMTEALQAIKGFMFTPEPLVEGGPDENLFHYLYEIEMPRYAACDRVDIGSNDDDLEGLRHLTFGEIEGERDI